MKRSSDKWCLCRGPDDGRFMIECSKCLEWFHCTCVALPNKSLKYIDTVDWYCPTCAQLVIKALQKNVTRLEKHLAWKEAVCQELKEDVQLLKARPLIATKEEIETADKALQTEGASIFFAQENVQSFPTNDENGMPMVNSENTTQDHLQHSEVDMNKFYQEHAHNLSPSINEEKLPLSANAVVEAATQCSKIEEIKEHFISGNMTALMQGKNLNRDIIQSFSSSSNEEKLPLLENKALKVEENFASSNVTVLMVDKGDQDVAKNKAKFRQRHSRLSLKKTY
ncbi:Set1 complex component spp1 [Frankliniella fusca]|uniref:Set1 complex component spp1 n=1 Tax=Frankliniella fusca TaxID=407009 RepID=A0AAE1L631_9NEOP|nr:Set1 complex component spp1 [Frankliniella fusca]